MSFVLDPVGMQELLEGPDGFAAQVLGAAAVRVETQAKLNATGVNVEGAQNPEQRGPRVRTGNLRSSITWVYGKDELGLYVAVGTNVYYGYWLETGLKNGYTYPFLVPAMSAV